MVDEQPVLQYRSLWFPTRASGERLMQMNLEYSLNQPHPGGQPSLAEVFWSTGSVSQALDLLPAYLPAEPKRIMRRLLQPWGDGRYTDAYARTGGILNLFTPSWGEVQDDVWAGMVTGWESATFPDEKARQEAFRALEQQRNTTPHPFFATLTPAQVLVGGGPQEAKLANEFLENLAHQLEGQPFESEGQALIQTVFLLRSWQNEPQPDGRTVFETIVAERSQLLARRDAVLKGSTARSTTIPSRGSMPTVV
jgi:hypothetical protein